eukprot:gb/GECG01016375.1/.p1 GENE.gb/GECG01016375.1/~~gb/GECG01016375.1/.p1  ORF type:complete len:107 (+),score=8.52 gb/GECG01016375.1/:1-321(+)
MSVLIGKCASLTVPPAADSRLHRQVVSARQLRHDTAHMSGFSLCIVGKDSAGPKYVSLAKRDDEDFLVKTPHKKGGTAMAIPTWKCSRGRSPSRNDGKTHVSLDRL